MCTISFFILLVLQTDCPTDCQEKPFATELLTECTTFKVDLDAALAASLVRDEGAPYFVPPYAAANFTPYEAMPFSNRGSAQQDYGGGAAYSNFRYFSEMLSAQFMGPETDVALSEFRESHFGTLSSLTRFRTHLDDMPAAGYACAHCPPCTVFLWTQHTANRMRGKYHDNMHTDFELFRPRV